MISLFALVLSILAIRSDARETPKIRVFEIVLDAESGEAAEPVLKKVQETVQPKPNQPKSETDKLAMQLVTEIDLLLANQDPDLYDSESQEHSFIDETRSSIVVMPPDSDKVYHIVRDTIKRTNGNEKSSKPGKGVDWIEQLLQKEQVQGQDANKIEDKRESNTGKLAMQLVSEIDLLLGHQGPDTPDSESQEHSIFDETRSSIVVMPPDSDRVYRIVRDTVKKSEDNNKTNRPAKDSVEWVQHLQRDEVSNDYEMRQKRRSNQQLQDEISQLLK